MKQEHLFNPEAASDQELEAALAERAGAFYGEFLAERLEDPQYRNDITKCEGLHTELDLLRMGWRRHLEARDNQGISSAEYTRRSLDQAGGRGRKKAERRFHGTHATRKQRQAAYGKAEGIARNERMTTLAGAYWYEDHQEPFDEFLSKLNEQVDYLRDYVPDSPFATDKP